MGVQIGHIDRDTMLGEILVHFAANSDDADFVASGLGLLDDAVRFFCHMMVEATGEPFVGRDDKERFMFHRAHFEQRIRDLTGHGRGNLSQHLAQLFLIRRPAPICFCARRSLEAETIFMRL